MRAAVRRIELRVVKREVDRRSNSRVTVDEFRFGGEERGPRPEEEGLAYRTEAIKRYYKSI